MDCSFQSIQRQIFKNKRLPKFLFIVFPEITRVEVYDELRSTYVCVFLPQIRKKNIHFLENRILEKNTSIKYSDFLYLFKHETLINDCIHRLKQIQHFCKKHNIKLYFILPEFFLAKIDKTVLEKILDCNVNFYKESNVDYNQLAGLFNIKL